MLASTRKVRAGVLLLVLLATAAADAQPPQLPNYSILVQAAHNHWLQFNVSSGRLLVTGSGFGNFDTANTRNGRAERLNIHNLNGELFVQYEVAAPMEYISFELRNGKQLHLLRTPRGGSAVVPLDFQQDPNEPLRLTAGDGPHREVYRAASLWHLLVMRPEFCRRELVPLLEMFRPGWRLVAQAQEAEEELFHMAACGQMPDRQRWAALVAQLSDDRFARREAADRDLRAAGPALLPFLQRLDFEQLDAEQQSRLRRIVGMLAHAVEDDTAEQIASWMIADPDVWLALLSRPEEPTRRLAAAQLQKLLGQSIPFDPAAAAPQREKQIDRLRAGLSAGAKAGLRTKAEGEK